MSQATIICLPGLGGHKTSFQGYEKLLNRHKVLFTQIIDPKESFEEIKKICESQNSQNEKIIFLANCYGAQFGIRLIDILPVGKIKGLIIIEPFFAQFHFWRWPADVINRGILAILFLAEKLGIRRKKFWSEINYAKLSKYSIFFQPIFDMRWQPLPDYFKKIADILHFKLPKDPINVPTLLIFSPKGFMQDEERKKELSKLFVDTTIEEVQTKSHNIITLSQQEIAHIVLSWIDKLSI
jgi:hypothetical protein